MRGRLVGGGWGEERERRKVEMTTGPIKYPCPLHALCLGSVHALTLMALRISKAVVFFCWVPGCKRRWSLQTK